MQNKSHFKWLISMLIAFVVSLTVNAQTLTVSGTVKDGLGDPIIGANILEKGTTNGVITDLDGNFTLTVKSGAIITVSYIGYVTQEKIATSRMEFILKDDTEMLDEVVVVGYGVQKKSQVTGAISSVRSEDMENRTVTNAQDALQGKTAGVQIISASASPGATPTVRVRGYSSNTTSDPLFVVDGVRLTDISGIDPNDIESMEVLKDAASAAIYGAEAGNGVVLITTKKGKSGEGKISYNFQYTIQQVGKIPEVMNAQEYINYMTEGGLLDQNFIDENWDGKTDTNWADELFTNGVIQKHNLAFSNATDKGNYYVSLTYLDNNGIVSGDQDTYKRLSGSINAEQKLKSWLTIGTTNQFEKYNRKSVSSNSYQGSSMISIFQMDPLTPVLYSPSNLPANMKAAEAAGHTLLRDEDGNYYASSAFISSPANPFMMVNNNYTKNSGFRITGSAYANLNVIDGLVLTSRFGYMLGGSRYLATQLPYYGNGNTFTDFIGHDERSATNIYYQWENFANYAKTFGKHSINAMVGISFQERSMHYVTGSLTASGEDAVQKNDRNFFYLNFPNASAVKDNGGEETHNAQYSYFGRVGYDYANRYMVQASLRADAADLSYLSKNQRWGYFPAVSVGWTISNEKFFEPAKQVFSDLKLRASWGQNGSLSALGNYAYSTAISNVTNATWFGVNNSAYPFSLGNKWTLATAPSTMGNDDLKWETSEQLDLGFDACFLNDRLTLSFDWFDKKTKDLLVWNTKPSLSIGGTISPVNAGDVSNRGVEIEVGWRDKIGDFSYGFKGNIATLKNKVTYLDRSLSRIEGLETHANYYATYFEEGYPVYYFRGYRFNGVDPQTGDPTFKDLNNDGLISEGDKDYIGDAIPDVTFGMTLNAAWKGFDFLVFASGTQGNEIYNVMSKINFLTTNKLKEFWYDGRWTTPGQQASVPKANCNNLEKYAFSDAMVFDGSYLKIKQIQLGYTLPKNILNKISCSNARVYVSLDDMFTFTSYPGMDPEISTNATTGMGVDLGGYPSTKKIVLGFNIDF